MSQRTPGIRRRYKVMTGALLVAVALASAVSADTETAEIVFRDRISGPLVQSKCVNCHVEGGLSGHTRLVFVRSSNAAHEALNLRAFETLFADLQDEGGGAYVLNKIQGVSHGGGVQTPQGSADFRNMQRFLGLLDAAMVFRDHVSGPLVQSRCVNCHVEGGLSGHTRLVFARSANAAHETLNLRTFAEFLDAVEGGHERILTKIQGVNHGGGVQAPAGSADFDNLGRFLALLAGDPRGFVARLLEGLDDGATSLLFGITTPADEETVAGNAVTISATGAPTEAVHFAYRPAGASAAGFTYLGAAANRTAARLAWNTSLLTDGDHEVAALFAEDAGDSVTADTIEVSIDNVSPASAPDVVEDRGRKTRAVRADAAHEVITADGVVVTIPAGALAGDDRITLTVAGAPDPATAPGDAVGVGINVALASGLDTFRKAVTVGLPYPEGKPDGLVDHTSIPETGLSLWFFDSQTDTWELVPGGVVLPDADRVVADVAQTGKFGIFNAPLLRLEQAGTALAALDFGAETTALTFTVRNGNAASAPLAWTIAPPEASWLAVEPARGGSGSAAGTVVTVSVDRTGLASGDHAGLLRVRSNGGVREVRVSMRVPAPPGGGDGGDGGGGGCAVLPTYPGGGPSDPTLPGLLGLVMVYLVCGRRRLHPTPA